MFSIPGGASGNDGGGIKGLIGGVLSGIALLVLAAGLLFWNEGRTVKRTAVLAEGKSLVQSVEAGSVNPADEGKLLHVRAELAASSRLRDPEFAVEVEGLALRRRVEMYQWEEKKSKKSGDGKGYDYRYERDWHDEPIDHTGFNSPDGHQNPTSLPFPSGRWDAEEVRLGAFVLTSEAISALSDWQDVTPDGDSLPPNLAASLRVEAGMLTSADSLKSPAIGDIRIRFERVPLGPASVVAEQSAGRLQTYHADQGELLLAERGSASIEAMFAGAASRNSQLGWALRGGGFMVFWIAFGLMLRPISGLLGNLPIIGGIGRMLTTLVAALLALSLSLLMIISGWLFHRPWLLAIMVIALVAGFVWLAKRPRPATALQRAGVGLPPAPPASPPPPPPGF
ncbi:MAG: TMEM43 family protein [Pseudomarimonas sp.]